MDNFHSPVPPPLPRRHVRLPPPQQQPPPPQQPQQLQQQQVTVGTLGGPMADNCAASAGSAPCSQSLVHMPGFPLRAATVSHYSPYSPSRFHIDKRCQHRCSWKCFSIILILVTVALIAMVAYFAAVSTMRPIDSTNCILIQDVKAVTHETARIYDPLSTQIPTEESIWTSTMEHPSVAEAAAEQQQSDPQIQQSAQQWPSVLELQAYNIAHSTIIPPYNFWNTEFINKQPAFIRLNLTLPWGANFAVYGRRNVAPSVTQYDFVEFVKGGRVDHRIKRSIVQEAVTLSYKEHKMENAPRLERSVTEPMLVNVSLVQYLDTGRWFLSIYNDELQPYKVTLVVTEAEGVSTTCSNDCSGRGSCYLGKCDCIDGYQGADCSKSVCPVLCSSHGQYGGGVCHCEDNWKGAECDIPLTDCQVPDCNQHGQCVQGSCVCNAGWKGPFCSEPDCPDPNCSSHGACIQGKCYCKAGWQGERCNQVDEQVYRCLPGCSDHGTYDLELARCSCEEHWTGVDCSQPSCKIDCGPHGSCEQGGCRCHDNWTGAKCDQKPCDPRCAEHGQCRNGTCVCSQGWNGKHCTLPGCENGCSRNGLCILKDGEYGCECRPGWAGRDCSIHLEMECADEKDNDGDGMIDCSDSECCSHVNCTEHLMCIASSDPVEVLLRKQPPSVTAEFYQRVKFLVEERSVQSYAHMDEYTENRVAVMRGQVVTEQGLGIIGIRVSVDRESRLGFTLTRKGGWFDVLVNGGGAVTLQFQRSPFQPSIKTVFAPWNQIVVLPPIVMTLKESETFKPNEAPRLSFGTTTFAEFSGNIFANHEPCMDHDHETLRPIIVETWMPEKVGGLAGESLIFAETQIVQESIEIPGSNVYLMYLSSQAAGYMSIVRMQLTEAYTPKSLTHVHVHVEIEGSLYTKTYEADPNLTHTFAWNKRNVYKQKVYGIAQAKISVGYQHSTCRQIIWETQTATLTGFDVNISELGGWGLDIHHHYNFHEGILQKGDGSTLHFKNYPRMVKVVMGTGLQRSFECDNCNGPAKDARLLTPVALTSGPDGSIYVGDFNHVRRIDPAGNVNTVMILSATQVAYQYYLCVSPADGHLYISDPEKHQILRALSLKDVEDPTINMEAVVGSGERCIPGDEGHCGDGGNALEAKLAHPKGIAIAADKTMYIADGTNIRAVDALGIIHTLVGHHGHHNHWSPVPCVGAVSASQAQLQWPTGISLSPLDGSLHFIDDRLVLKLTSDMKVRVVAGTPLHCSNSAEPQKTNSTLAMSIRQSNEVLGSVLAIAFSPTGELYIADSDSHRANSIRVVHSSGKMSLFAGQRHDESSNRGICECTNNSTTPTGSKLPEACSCIDESSSSTETLLSSNAKFIAISALTVAPNGVLHVADQGSLHILALEPYLPNHDESGDFHIPYPPSNEVYVFNRYGQHVATKDLTSGKTRYAFLYSKNTSFGRLSTVTDSAGNKIQFLRDYSSAVSSIENTQDYKTELKISGVGFLEKLSEKGREEITLNYDSETGLLTSRSGGRETYVYHYDNYGRVIDVILPTGEKLKLSSDLYEQESLIVKVKAPVQGLKMGDDQRVIKFVMKNDRSKLLTITNGESSRKQVASYDNATCEVSLPGGGRLVSAATAKHPLLEAALPVEAEMLPMWSSQSMSLGEYTNVMNTVYNLVGDVSHLQQTLNREIWVNDSRVLGIEFDQAHSRETFYDKTRIPLLTITFDQTGQPISWQPQTYGHNLTFSYDKFNRVRSWQWGPAGETYAYDRRSRLSEITNELDGTRRFTYNDFNVLSKITLASDRYFTLQYDEDGGLRHIVLPSGTMHSFSCQASIGFLRVTYTPPGTSKSYLQHYSHDGKLLQTVFPGDGARIVYRYHTTGQLAEVVHGDGKSEMKYTETGLPAEVIHSERTDMEYRWDYQYNAGLLVEERIDFGAKAGLSNAKFTFEYDSNFRLVAIQGRIGGQTLPTHVLAYSSRTGTPEQIGQFKIFRPKHNETIVSDGTAVISRLINMQFLETQVTVTMHSLEVFRMEFTHDAQGRINQTRTYTRNVGVNTYTNIKNFTWDSDGQLKGVEAQEPWGFTYDPNGNMLSLTYRGNTIPMEYNSVDRIIKFGEGSYKYDNRGLVIQNAREERFSYNAKGLLVRATKKGRFDVRYYYDHLDRLSTRKDNYGNVTQFFYTNQKRPREVSQIYNPRDGKLMSLVYDDRGHLIFAQVYRYKYYIATDQCGTPVMIFNQYGEWIREIMRSPYGHIVYDSNPYLYLPIDFCGGLLDQVTSLVHMPNGKVYDPLIGQWMTPLWENVLDRALTPTHLHLYRFNGNDPINVRNRERKKHPTDYIGWLSLLGYDLKSMAPQLFPNKLPDSLIPPSLKPMTSILGRRRRITNLGIQSGFLAHVAQRHSSDAAALSVPPRSALKKDMTNDLMVPSRLGSASEPTFGKGILVSRLSNGQAVVSSVPAADHIYRDVFTSVFNESHFLPFTFVIHSAQQDAFYFVKEESWKVADDRNQIKRLGGHVNTTFHESSNVSGTGGNVMDVKMHGSSYVINLRYGTSAEKEKQRLLHHAKASALRKAWHREREALKTNAPTVVDWMASEQDEIVKSGQASNYEAEYVHDVQVYPELAEDPYNVRFVKKTTTATSATKKRRRRRGASNSNILKWWGKFC